MKLKCQNLFWQVFQVKYFFFKKFTSFGGFFGGDWKLFGFLSSHFFLFIWKNLWPFHVFESSLLHFKRQDKDLDQEKLMTIAWFLRTTQSFFSLLVFLCSVIICDVSCCFSRSSSVNGAKIQMSYFWYFNSNGGNPAHILSA